MGMWNNNNRVRERWREIIIATIIVIIVKVTTVILKQTKKS